ncbi:hypothetical protein DRO47_04455 [Candidatus Bathyarchaeota archaeon]|nr:MAG: hypothetical protein DRO47_04455 [Candidatus Bathyarchaeota archaeon]
MEIKVLKPMRRGLCSGMDTFCGWAKKAREGSKVYVCEENISCPLATFKLGYGKPSGLEETLVGWGDAATIREAKLYLENTVVIDRKVTFLLGRSLENPDLIVYFGDPDEVMRLIRRYVSLTGERVACRVSGIGAMCGELCAYPYMTNKPSLSVGCEGSRSRVFRKNEIAVSFPRDKVSSIELDD